MNFRLGLARKLVSAYWQIALTYRGSLLIEGLHALLMPSILMLVWLSVKRTPDVLYSDGDYLLYYLAMPVVMTITACMTVYEIPEEIRNGTLSRNLLKPFHPLWQYVFKNIAFKMVKLIYLLPVVFSIGWFLGDRLPVVDLSIPRAFLIASILCLGIILRYVMTTFLAMTGFWIEHVETLNLVVNAGIWAIFGGMIVPIETMPPWIRPVAHVLPYRYCLSFPIEVLRGHLVPSEILFGLAIGSFWCFAFFILLKFLWRKGLRQYTAYGG